MSEPEKPDYTGWKLFTIFLIAVIVADAVVDVVKVIFGGC